VLDNGCFFRQSCVCIDQFGGAVLDAFFQFTIQEPEGLNRALMVTNFTLKGNVQVLQFLTPLFRGMPHPALAALHQTAELAGHRAASEGVELDRHRGLRSAALADIPRIPVACEARIAPSSVLGNGESGPRRRRRWTPVDRVEALKCR